MADAAISVALQTIANLLTEKARFIHGVKDQVIQLQAELEWMQKFLEDADSKKSEEDRMRPWIILKFKDAAYDAEDLLEKYAFKVESNRRDGGFVEVLSKCVLILNISITKSGQNYKLSAPLSTRISNLKDSFKTYRWGEDEGSSSKQQLFRRTYSSVEEEDFVGLESDVDLLAQHLVNEIEHYRAVSIYGTGGIGKTTLAKKVYKHPNVRGYFNGFALIPVSQQWQTKDILQKILVQLEPERKKDIQKQGGEDELMKNLLRVQVQRRCLIVLDDVWDTAVWDCIKHAFLKRQKGSKMLLTTRKREVALHIDPVGFYHEPRLLSEDESWELL